MKHRLTYILALTGLLFLLAHQMVPHCHCPEPERGEMCETPESEESNWLSKIFGTDIGANHLETYEVVKTQNITPQLLGILQVFIQPQILSFFSLQLQSSSCATHIPVPILLRGHITTITLRPPPVA